MVIFTDGSWIPEIGAGAAAVMHGSDRKVTVSLPLHEVITNFKAELTGIDLAALLAQEVIESDIDQTTTGVAIFCDNQGALLWSAWPIGCVAGQALAVTNFFSLKTLKMPVILYWSPGHKGTNWQICWQKKLPTTHQKKNNTTLVPSFWRVSPKPDRGARSTLQRRRKRVAQALDALERGLASTIHQLRADHALLRKFLFKIKSVLDPRCASCGVWEIAHHFVLFFSRFQTQRSLFKRQLRGLKCGVNPNSFQSIMDKPKAMGEIGNYHVGSVVGKANGWGAQLQVLTLNLLVFFLHLIYSFAFTLVLVLLIYPFVFSSLYFFSFSHLALYDSAHDQMNVFPFSHILIFTYTLKKKNPPCGWQGHEVLQRRCFPKILEIPPGSKSGLAGKNLRPGEECLSARPNSSCHFWIGPCEILFFLLLTVR
ncbi:hypothetical protein VP01_2939g1 [Puccinia sorghi]|uniref:RNase H type-1 domain-containing protein n=1 Tax=Puccinia sorghi TaxID=27349 RepID=A0A0L6V153_9BASI|nr:hypothetical protein VP01_2939g1 [Puccinia sorghi]